MLLKWIFTFLAILWVVRLVRRALAPPPEEPRQNFQPPPQKDAEGSVHVQRREADDDADFIDYEEIK